MVIEPKVILNTMPSLCSDPKAQNVVYTVKMGLERLERLKINQDKVTMNTLSTSCKHIAKWGFCPHLQLMTHLKNLLWDSWRKHCLRSGNSDCF